MTKRTPLPSLSTRFFSELPQITMVEDSQEGDKQQNEEVRAQVLSRFYEDRVELMGLLDPHESKQENIGEAIGKRISTLRQKKGLSQSELAEKIGKKHAWLSKVERGNTRFLVEDLIGLADALESSLNQLIPSEDDAESLAADLRGQGGSGNLFMFKLEGSAFNIAVAGSSENSEDLRDRLRRKISRLSARVVSKMLLQYFDLEYERIQEFKEKHEYVKASIEDGYRHVTTSCIERGEATLSIRVASAGETEIDWEGSTDISLETPDGDRSDG